MKTTSKGTTLELDQALSDSGGNESPAALLGEVPQHLCFGTGELGALAHLYRGELYRSKVWRTRLDTTTNWAVGTTGIALSITFSGPQISPAPLVLIGLLVMVFMFIEARRYRYFDIWRTRVRLMEVCFYGPLLRGQGIKVDNGWNEILVRDYIRPRFHISHWEALGRRLRRNYAWIFSILGISYLVKLAIHPTTVHSFAEIAERASLGPVPGIAVLLFGTSYYVGLVLLALLTLRAQHASGRVSGPAASDPVHRFGVHV